MEKKKFNYNEKRKKKKNWCRNLEISYCMICIVRLYCGEQWQRQGAGLGIRRAQGRWARQQARTGALGHRRACWGAGPCSERWGVWQSAGRAAWAPGLALGSALGALGPFSIRFDSFFFFLSHQMNTVHCKIKFFSKKKKIFIKFK